MDTDFGFWDGFQAAHVFSLAYEDHRNKHNFSRWIIKQPVTGGSINSLQNGLLLRTDIHQQFDNYILSINPDVCISSCFPFY